MSQPDVTPKCWVVEYFNAGRPRFRWECDGCQAHGVGIVSRELAHKAVLAHVCPDAIPPESPTPHSTDQEGTP